MKMNEEITLLTEYYPPIHDERIKQCPCEDMIEGIIERVDCERILELAKSILPDVSYQVIIRRFGFYDGCVWGFLRIGKELNISRKQAYAIYRISIEILRFKVREER